MRLPQKWDDGDLLKDEPFLSVFCTRRLQSGFDTRRRSSNIKVAVRKDIESNKKSVEAASRWLHLAFVRQELSDPTDDIMVTKDTLGIFITFYWIYFRHDKPTAFKYLQRQRKAKRYSPLKSDFEGAVPTRAKPEPWNRKRKRKRPCKPNHKGSASGGAMHNLKLTSVFCDTSTLNTSKNRHARTSLSVASRKHGKASIIMSAFQCFPHDRSSHLEQQTIVSSLSGAFENILNSTSRHPPECLPSSMDIHHTSHTQIQSESAVTASEIDNGVMGESVVVRMITECDPNNGCSSEGIARCVPKHASCNQMMGSIDENGMIGVRDETVLATLDMGKHSVMRMKMQSAGNPPGLDKVHLQKLEQPQLKRDFISSADVIVVEKEDHEDVTLSRFKTAPVDSSVQPVDLKVSTDVPDYPSPNVYKDPLFRLPPIWAESRQEVCESFEWFRSYQGGVYFSHNLARGYLLSAFPARRDIFEYDGRLIISHGGGKAETMLTQRGNPIIQPAEDQFANDKSVQALLNNFRERRPLVLLVDDKYVQFPYDLGSRGITYAVLGFYMIVNAWAEFQPANNDRGKVVRYKFAFQWCDSQGLPWWIPQDDKVDLRTFEDKIPSKRRTYNLSHLRDFEHAQFTRLCICCGCRSPCVYGTWACLVPECQLFWRNLSGEELSEPLQYNHEFLQLNELPPLPPGYVTTAPAYPAVPLDGTAGDYAMTRGWHCFKCGRLSCRYKWEQWECKYCHAAVRITSRIRTAKEFWTQTVPVSFRDHNIVYGSGIVQQRVKVFAHENGYGQYQTFIMPKGRGYIHHIQPGNALGKLEADKIFQKYQEQAASGELEFRRWPLRSHKCRGDLLTNYFSQNTGEPYQYVGGTENTVPFSKAASAVLLARELIQDRIRQALGKTVSFNEVLSAAYMEKQKMAFHSDNEIGLGPLVAGLSLGSPAVMHFRLISKHNLREGCSNIALSFVLRHGDVLVMDGADIQEFYAHTVVPTNFRIAATARCINANENAYL